MKRNPDEKEEKLQINKHFELPDCKQESEHPPKKEFKMPTSRV